jgi:hypothetical protein
MSRLIARIVAALGAAGVHAMVVALLIVQPPSKNPSRSEVLNLGTSDPSDGADSDDRMILLDLAALETQDDASLAVPMSTSTFPLDLSIQIEAPNLDAAIASLEDESEVDQSKSLAPSDAVAQALQFGRYVGQVSARVERAWIRPRSSIDGDRFACKVRIEQDRAGRVLSVELIQCNGDSQWQESLVFAIERASPLSAPPDPSVFTSQLVVDFSSSTYVAGVSREDEYQSPEIHLARQQP